MSIKIMSAVFEGDLPPVKRLVMLALADHADDEGLCYPSINRLCKRTGLSERAVQKHVKELEVLGYLSRGMNEGKRGVNTYLLTPARRAPPHDVHPARRAPLPPHDVHPTPARRAPEPSRTIIEPSNKDQSSPDPSFSEFWERWPLRRQGKQKAETAFRRLSKQNKRRAIDEAQEWAKRWRQAYPKANDIHPSSYLNGKRWEDEFEAADPDRSAKMDRWRKLAGKESTNA